MNRDLKEYTTIYREMVPFVTKILGNSGWLQLAGAEAPRQKQVARSTEFNPVLDFLSPPIIADSLDGEVKEEE